METPTTTPDAATTPGTALVHRPALGLVAFARRLAGHVLDVADALADALGGRPRPGRE